MLESAKNEQIRNVLYRASIDYKHYLLNKKLFNNIKRPNKLKTLITPHHKKMQGVILYIFLLIFEFFKSSIKNRLYNTFLKEKSVEPYQHSKDTIKFFYALVS